jgi:hypothetical protein
LAPDEARWSEPTIVRVAPRQTREINRRGGTRPAETDYKPQLQGGENYMDKELIAHVVEAAEAADIRLDRMATILSLFLLRASKRQSLVGGAVLRGLSDEIAELS